MTKSKPSRKKKPPPFDWRPYNYIGATGRRPDGRDLFVYVAGNDEIWLALAIDSPRGGGAQAVLDNHGHRLLGEFATVDAARRAAESFGRRWLRGRSSVEACGCDDIKVPRRRPRRARRAS